MIHDVGRSAHCGEQRAGDQQTENGHAQSPHDRHQDRGMYRPAYIVVVVPAEMLCNRDGDVYKRQDERCAGTDKGTGAKCHVIR